MVKGGVFLENQYILCKILLPGPKVANKSLKKKIYFQYNNRSLKQQVGLEHFAIVYVFSWKTSKVWVFHHKIFNYIHIQVASFPNFFNCLMYSAYKRSGIITHRLINIFVSKLLLISIPNNNCKALITTFYNNVFFIFQIIKCTPLFPSKIVVFALRNFNFFIFI